MERSELVAELMTRIGSIKRLMHAQRYTCTNGDTINGPQVSVLFAIKRQGPSSQHELAQHLHMTPGGVSQLIDQLITSQLITREQDAHDRRTYRLSLTEAGVAFTERIAKQHHEVIQQTTADINDTELQQFICILDKIAAALQKNNESEKE